MPLKIPAIRHVRGFDVARPISIGVMLGIVAYTVMLERWVCAWMQDRIGPNRVGWCGLLQPLADGLKFIFKEDVLPHHVNKVYFCLALKLSLFTSFWATAFNVIFGLLAAYVLSRYDFWGRNAVIVTISLPTAIPTAVAGFALLLLWGPYGVLGRLLNGVQLMFTAYAIILANIFVTFPLAFGVIKPVFDTMSRSLEEASATIGATRWQTFWYVTLPSLRGAIVGGALLTFARAVGEFGSTILVSGNLAGRTQTAPLYIFAKFNEGQIEAANAIAIVLALLSFVIFSVLFFARDWLEFEAQEK